METGKFEATDFCNHLGMESKTLQLTPPGMRWFLPPMRWTSATSFGQVRRIRQTDVLFT